MRKTALAAILIIFLPSLARADTNTFPANCSVPVPNISDWEAIQQSQIEFRLSNQAVAFLGLVVESKTYRNSHSGEIIKVFSRHIPMIFAEQKQDDERLLEEAVALFYAEKEKNDLLAKLKEKIDPLLYVYWRIRINPRNGNDMLDGDVNIWFMSSDGSCQFSQNKKIGIQFMTENVGNGQSRNVFVGVKYQIDGAYHILKVDRRDVANLMEREK